MLTLGCSPILVVDDDADITANLCDILTDIGYDADAAHDAVGALDMCQKRSFDLALLDFLMQE